MKIAKLDHFIFAINILDHLAISIYLFQAPFIASILMPNFDDNTQLALIYGFFASSIFTKPFGSFLFGNLASKFGPKYSVFISSGGISLSLIYSSLIPSMEIAAELSIYLLLLSRILSGIFSSGFSGVAKIILLEGKDDKNSLRASYYYPLSSSFGAILASIISIFYYENFRIIFFTIGVIIFILLFVFNFNKESSKIYSKNNENLDIKILKGIWNNFRKNLTIIFLTSLSYITWYVPFVLINSLLEKNNQNIFSELMLYNSMLMSLDILFIPIIGMIIEKINYIIVMMISSLFLSIIFITILPGIQNYSLFEINILKIIIIITGIFFFCPHHYYFKKLYSGCGNKKYIYIGTSIAFGSAVFGKTIPFLSFYIMSSFRSFYYVCVVFFVISSISFLLITYDYISNKYIKLQ